MMYAAACTKHTFHLTSILVLKCEGRDLWFLVVMKAEYQCAYNRMQ